MDEEELVLNYWRGELILCARTRDAMEKQRALTWARVRREAARVQEALSDVVERHTTGRGEPK